MPSSVVVTPTPPTIFNYVLHRFSPSFPLSLFLFLFISYLFLLWLFPSPPHISLSPSPSPPQSISTSNPLYNEWIVWRGKMGSKFSFTGRLQIRLRDTSWIQNDVDGNVKISKARTHTVLTLKPLNSQRIGHNLQAFRFPLGALAQCVIVFIVNDTNSVRCDME